MSEAVQIKPPRPDGWGWLRDRPDARDLRYAAPRAALRAIPLKADLRLKFNPPVFDQQAIGSCVAQGGAFAFMFARDRLKMARDWVPSRLFIYYHARARIGSPLYDGGCYIRDAMDVLRKLGAPPESYWPYKATPSDPQTWLWNKGDFPAKLPGARATTEAEKHQAIAYFAINQDIMSMKACITEGWPIVFGAMIYSSLYSWQGVPKTLFPMPSGSDYPLGGHCMVVVGYDDTLHGGVFIIRNSWGTDVGEGGFFYMPYAYLASVELASDFWTLRAVENRVPGVQ